MEEQQPEPPQDPEVPVEEEEESFRRSVPSLETLAMNEYMVFLESEAVSLVSLLNCPSRILAGMADKFLNALKSQLDNAMAGVPSSVLRTQMMERILSEEFPSSKFCQRVKKIPQPGTTTPLLASHSLPFLYSPHIEETRNLNPCISPCCTGQFVREVMAGVVMSSDLKELIFTSEKMPESARAVATLQAEHRAGCVPRQPDAASKEFNVTVVLNHLLSSTEGKVSQLERIVFSESFVKEEDSSKIQKEQLASKTLGLSKFKAHVYRRLIRQQLGFNKNFSSTKISETSDRKGIAVNLLVLFRDVRTRTPGFNKLTELILKNNIQSELYSKANFQFEFLSRIGSSCPRLRVLDIFGTDTWADCLVALFFRDAFHTLHRYLYFMENEEDESSAYHPHDIKRYCQFCLDQMHSNSVERPNTINPVIPLIDEIYERVLKRYPKKSYCILRNCVRVTDLINAPMSTVFELVRNEKIAKAELEYHPLKHRCKKDQKNGTADDAKSSGESNESLSKKDTPRRSVRLLKQTYPSKGGKANKSQRKTRECVKSFKSKKPSNKLTDTVDKESGQESSASLAYLSSDERSNGMITRSRKRQHSYDYESTTLFESTLLPRKLSKRISADNLSDSNSTRSTQYCSSLLSAVNSTFSKASFSKSSSQSNVSNEPPSSSIIPYERWYEESSRCQCLSDKMCNSMDSCPFSTRAANPVVPKKCKTTVSVEYNEGWDEPENVHYREITNWPHLNLCTQTLEVLNIGGTNVLGEFIPFIFLHLPKLRSLGQWINTMIYGLEILRDVPGCKDIQFPKLQEFSYSTDRNYFCQPYIGFVPEAAEFRSVRKEMVKFSGKVTKKISNSARNHQLIRDQVKEDMELIRSTCPNIQKLNLVLHFTFGVLDANSLEPLEPLKGLTSLTELDLVTMRFSNVQALLKTIGHQLSTLTIEMDDEQGVGSELAFIAQQCPDLKQLRLLIGEKNLRGEMNLHFGFPYFRHLESVVVEGTVHLHAFAFLWGHCRNLKFFKTGLVVSNELNNSNAIIQDVLTLLFQINSMEHLEELHIKDLKLKSIDTAKIFLEKLPKLRRISNWIIELADVEEIDELKQYIEKYIEKGLQIEYNGW